MLGHETRLRLRRSSYLPSRFLEDIRAGPDRLSNLHEGHVTLLQSASRSVLHVGWAQGQCQWVSRTNRATAPPKVFAEFALRRKMDAQSASLSYFQRPNYGVFLHSCLPLYIVLIHIYEHFSAKYILN